jgi:hypothetical protein
MIFFTAAHASSSSAGGGAAFEDVAEEASHALTQHQLIDGFAGLGHVWAIEVKLYSLEQGGYAYHGVEGSSRVYACEPNLEAAKRLIEDFLGQQNDFAIHRKILGLLSGGYGYEINPEAAITFLKEQQFGLFLK